MTGVEAADVPMIADLPGLLGWFGAMLRNLNNISSDANLVGSVSETAAIRPPAELRGYDPTCQGPA